MKAVMAGAQSIALGLQRTIVAGGMESMSNAPYLLEKARAGYGYGHQQVVDAVLKDGLWDARYQVHMGDCAEETAAKYSIGREAQDAFAVESYRRAAAAWESGKFAVEIVPVAMQGRPGAPVTMVSEDEEFRKVDFSKVPKLRPAFKPEGGTVTAANASTLNDGASALLLMHKDRAEELGVKPLARILSMADAECNPKLFTIAPSLAIPMALERAGVQAADVALFEINEAFSVVALANQQASLPTHIRTDCTYALVDSWP
jgi:acetyl-CoA C-acetyltransferase